MVFILLKCWSVQILSGEKWYVFLLRASDKNSGQIQAIWEHFQPMLLRISVFRTKKQNFGYYLGPDSGFCPIFRADWEPCNFTAAAIVATAVVAAGAGAAHCSPSMSGAGSVWPCQPVWWAHLACWSSHHTGSHRHSGVGGSLEVWLEHLLVWHLNQVISIYSPPYEP